MNRPCLCGRFFSFRGRMAEDKSLKYMLLTLALALTCTLVGSMRLSGADGGGGRKARDSVLALVPDTSRLLLVSGHTHFVSRDAHMRIRQRVQMSYVQE